LQPACNLAVAASNLKIVSLRSVDSLIGLFDRVPYALLALPLRVGAATTSRGSAYAAWAAKTAPAAKEERINEM
jgi:hypothetical protein